MIKLEMKLINPECIRYYRCKMSKLSIVNSLHTHTHHLIGKNIAKTKTIEEALGVCGLNENNAELVFP